MACAEDWTYVQVGATGARQLGPGMKCAVVAILFKIAAAVVWGFHYLMCGFVSAALTVAVVTLAIGSPPSFAVVVSASAAPNSGR